MKYKNEENSSELMKENEKLEQKNKSLESQLQTIEEDRFKFNVTNMIESQMISSKDSKIKSLEEIVSEQETYISALQKKLEQLKELTESKSNEIQSLEETNLMLKKQLTNSLKES